MPRDTIRLLEDDERELIILMEDMLQNGNGPRRQALTTAEIVRKSIQKGIILESGEVEGILFTLSITGHVRSSSDNRWTLTDSGVRVVFP